MIASQALQQTRFNRGIHFPDIHKYNLEALMRVFIDWIHKTSQYIDFSIDAQFTKPSFLQYESPPPPRKNLLD